MQDNESNIAWSTHLKMLKSKLQFHNLCFRVLSLVFIKKNRHTVYSNLEGLCTKVSLDFLKNNMITTQHNLLFTFITLNKISKYATEMSIFQPNLSSFGFGSSHS